MTLSYDHFRDIFVLIIICAAIDLGGAEICTYLDEFQKTRHITCSTGCCGNTHKAYCCITEHFGAIVLGSVIGFFILVALITILVYYCLSRRSKSTDRRSLLSATPSHSYGSVGPTSTYPETRRPETEILIVPPVQIAVTPPSPIVHIDESAHSETFEVECCPPNIETETVTSPNVSVTTNSGVEIETVDEIDPINFEKQHLFHTTDETVREVISAAPLIVNTAVDPVDIVGITVDVDQVRQEPDIDFEVTRASGETISGDIETEPSKPLDFNVEAATVDIVGTQLEEELNTEVEATGDILSGEFEIEALKSVEYLEADYAETNEVSHDFDIGVTLATEEDIEKERLNPVAINIEADSVETLGTTIEIEDDTDTVGEESNNIDITETMGNSPPRTVVIEEDTEPYYPPPSGYVTVEDTAPYPPAGTVTVEYHDPYPPAGVVTVEDTSPYPPGGVIVEETRSYPPAGIVTVEDTEPYTPEVEVEFQPDVEPYVPDTQPYYPDTRPYVPDTQPYYPDTQPYYPDTQPYVPDTEPYYPDNEAAGVVIEEDTGPYGDTVEVTSYDDYDD